MSSKRIRQKGTEEFKRDAVQMVIENQYRSNMVGRRLGVNGSNIFRWVTNYNADRLYSTLGYKTPFEYEKEQYRYAA